MSKKSWKQIDEREFKLVKDLQGAGLSIQKAADVTGRSWGTIRNMYNTNTLDEYKEVTKEERYRYERKAAEAALAVAEASSVEAEQPAEVPTSEAPEVVLDSATRIAVALERLADAWEQSPKKRSLF